MDFLERARLRLKHWMDHNEKHREEYAAFADQLEQAGEPASAVHVRQMAELAAKVGRGASYTLWEYIATLDVLQWHQQKGDQENIRYYRGMVEGFKTVFRCYELKQDAGLLKELYDKSCALRGKIRYVPTKLPPPTEASPEEK